MTITQAKFEKYVPSFRNATEEVFQKVEDFIEEEKLQLSTKFGAAYEEKLNDARLAEKTVCTGAAYHVFSHMDIVLTATGFGVVRNDHLTPASRERTGALRDDLRKEYSRLLDVMLATLLRSDWKESTEAAILIDSLLYCPTMLRRYGVKTPQGGEIYHDEMLAIAGALAESAASVERCMSPELYADLVMKQRDEAGMEPEERLVLEAARKYQAALLIASHPKSAVELHKRLVRLLEQYSTVLTAYANSSTYAANHFQRYENKQEDPTFFFG